MYQYPKSFLSVAPLIQKLIDTGMTIDSQNALILNDPSILRTNNYIGEIKA